MNKNLKLTTKQIYIATLFNLLIILYIGCKYLKYTENISGFLSYFYMVASLIGHFFLICILPFLVSLIILYTFKSISICKIIFSVLSVAIIIYLQIDILVYSQFRYHLSPIVFKLLFGKRATDTFQFSAINILISIIFILGLVVCEIFILYISKKIANRIINLHIKLILSFITFCLLCTHLLFAWSDANRYRSIAQMKNIYPVFFPLTADKLLHKLNLVDKNEIEKNTLLSKSYSKAIIKYPLHPIKSQNSKKKNILFIVIDSWRFNCMTEKITPNIYQLSKQSQVFQNHKSGSNMTTGGIFSLFYAIPATYYDQFTGLQISPVFFEELKKQNYNLSILSSSTLENPPFNKNVFSGIKNLRLESQGNSSSERDKDIYNEWIKFINMQSSNKKPFFSFLFFDSAHGFDYPADYPIKFKPTLNEVNYLVLNDTFDPLPFLNRYKNSLNYIDNLIGGVLKKLEQKGLLESTLVVITGDHGQEFNDNHKGYWQHGGNFSDYQIATPLIIYDSAKKPASYTYLTLHYDIIPTIMSSILGVQNNYNDYSEGKDLYISGNRDWFICGYNQKYAIVENNMIINIYSSGMYDVVDKNLNPLDDSKIDLNIVKEAVKENTRFYNISKN